MRRKKPPDKPDRGDGSASPDFVQDRVRDLADEVGRDLGAVKLGQVAMDLAHRHTPCVKDDDFIVEAVEASLALGDQPQLERAGAIARYFDGNVAVFGQYRLGARAVAAVVRAAARWIALLVAEMIA